MKLRFLRPRLLTEGLRDLARRRPEEAGEYIDAHHAEWEELVGDDPENAADILEALDSRTAADLLTGLEAEDIGEVLDEMNPEAAADILEELTPSAAAVAVAEMDADQAADLLAALDDDVRVEVLAAIDPEAAAEISELLGYATDSAGGLMTREVAALPVGLTTGEAIERLRQIHEELGSNISYVYVVDDGQRLNGVISFRDLVFARPGQGLDEVMVADPYFVHPEADREVVAELIQRFHLLAVPVVDHRRVLLGMVKVDEVMEAVAAEASEDIAVMVGAGHEETVYTPVLESSRHRLPWIVVNLVASAIVAIVISRFDSIIQGETLLAALMPMVAGVGGNAGAQSLAVMIRAMAVGDMGQGRARRAVRRELLIAVVNGAVIATLAGLATGWVTGSARFGEIMAISLVVNIVVAGVVGGSMPLILRRLGFDPALASNIFLTAVTDVVGFGGFLLTALLLL
ncbi:MAG: magnesium transporter [Actinomycetota bacterium]|nr:magnesium transporter [Actinomycetota bacterium]